MTTLFSRISRSTVLYAVLVITGCTHAPVRNGPPPPDAATAAQLQTPLILISIDGFKPDYLTRGVTPNLNALAAAGVRAEAMSPSFPSITFPNHYTLVTGLRPDHHGVVGNTMEDPAIPGVRFSLGNRDALVDSRWWDQAEPIWVTAEKQGIKTATMFWPGSEVAIHGMRPSEWRPFDGKVTPDQRVATLLGWLDKPATTRPQFLTLYFDDVDHSGHEHGPDSELTTKAAANVDVAIGKLLQGLQTRQIAANIVIVSDHGMAAISSSRTVRLDQIAAPASYRIITSGTYAGIEPVAGQEQAVAAALLSPHEHMQCWRKAEIPARFHYGQNARVPSFVCLAEVGWFIVADQRGADRTKGGSHGYDNLSPEMQAIFIASGPAFKQNLVLPAFDNVDVYPLLMSLIGVQALPSDGNVNTLLPAIN